MGFIRAILHVASFGIVDSNEETKRKKVEEKRRKTPFSYPDIMPEAKFRDIVIRIAKPINRLKVSVKDQFVYCTVRTVSGINTWSFIIDFNDYGTITGRYWIRDVENNNSTVPNGYAKQLSMAIIDALKATDN